MGIKADEELVQKMLEMSLPERLEFCVLVIMTTMIEMISRPVVLFLSGIAFIACLPLLLLLSLLYLVACIFDKQSPQFDNN